MARTALLHGLLAVLFVGSLVRVAPAAQPVESILPATTKLFIATLDVDETRKKFQATQLGALSQDPLMQPFIEDLKKQISRKMNEAGNGMGITWEDMEGVYGGEVALARIQPDFKDKNSYAMAVIIDITGKRAQADTLLGKIDIQQKKEGATRREVKIADGLNGVEYVQKVRAGAPRVEKDYYFIKDNFLVATDWYPIAQGMAARIGNEANKDSLASIKAFQYSMERNAAVAKQDGLNYHVRWFVEPFGFLEASRAANRREAKKGPDLLKILQTQGFNAIQGVGGYVFFDTPDDELLHRTFAYAPPIPGEKDKYKLAARMLKFPNTKTLVPQTWVKDSVGTYLTLNWHLQDAFKYSETLIDAVAGEPGVFDDLWASMKDDPHGPKIDIYKGLVNELGERVSIISDVLQPVNEKSERMLVAIDVKNEATVRATIDKFFKGDPTARRREFEGHGIWEIENEQTAAAGGPMLSIEGTETEFVAAEKDEEEEERKLPNMAVTVYGGHLVIATHYDYIVELLKNVKDKKPELTTLKDFTRVETALNRLGQGNDSFRYFAKTEESYRATYEMLKQNKLPQTESMFARLLNAILDSNSEDGNRENEIDGSKLPDYAQIVKYLGPTGLFVQSEEQGWWIVGSLLTRDPVATGK
ncbi:hypothetical protein ETAA8_46300 [Anatilimnocola aggregata]|uniref:DUF3352 domain-containing protein n=1 Tax=Anatilimnocola aggregata TaxID=2528021 RepID=A0A517YH36_9BACT|nr:hypothetical protein [Anatilimnocola aggregata]QDU29518.1 hypothetical protein ETAA8_46300 [Anatilimnocola aggregata]